MNIKSLSTLLLIIILFHGCGNKELKNEQKKEEASEIVILKPASIKEIQLSVDTISFRKFDDILKLPARVIVNQDNEAQVGSLITGRVKNVLVKIGDHVKAGQVLMNIEGLEISSTKAAYLKAKANHDYCKSNYDRQKSLIDQNIGSQKTYLESKAEYEKALAELKSEHQRIHSIGLSEEEFSDNKSASLTEHIADFLPVKSSINGVVVERNVVIGQLVEGNTTAFRIINTSSVWIDGQVSEKDIAKIKDRTNVLFKSPSYSDQVFRGKIINIGQVLDEKTRTLNIRAEFNNSDLKLKPQMFGELYVPLNIGEHSIVIPNESIVIINNQSYVFVQKNDTTFEKRSISAHSSHDGVSVVENGLKEGEKLVTKGVFFLKSELLKNELGGE